MGIAKNYWSESDTFALSSKERLLPKEALREGGDDANFDDQPDDGFDSSKHDERVMQ